MVLSPGWRFKMGWRGSFVPIPGLLTGFVGSIVKVYAFDDANTLRKVTWRVNDAPSGGAVVIRVHDQADGQGDYREHTIADGENFVTGDVSMATIDGLWQEVESEGGNAVSLSGEYEMSTSSGITQFFTTLAHVKVDLKETGVDADRDIILNQLIEGVTRQMQSWMGRDIVQGTMTDEKIDGPVGDSIFTQEFPILEITSLEESDTALVEDTDFESVGTDQKAGRIVRLAGTSAANWLRGRRNIKLTYDHGFAVVPEDLVTAATALVAAKWFETTQSTKAWRGLASKGVDPNAATVYDKEIWSREVIPAMQHYRRLRA